MTMDYLVYKTIRIPSQRFYIKEHRDKNSQSNLGKPATKGFTGSKHINETLIKMRNKHSKPKTPITDEHRLSLSEAIKKSWAPGGTHRLEYERTHNV
jgi:hypothetical protein